MSNTTTIHSPNGGTFSDKTKYDKLGDAINHLDKLGQDTDSRAQVWMKNFEEFTGYKPNHPVNAFDVVKLMHRFYGEPKL